MIINFRILNVVVAAVLAATILTSCSQGTDKSKAETHKYNIGNKCGIDGNVFFVKYLEKVVTSASAGVGQSELGFTIEDQQAIYQKIYDDTQAIINNAFVSNIEPTENEIHYLKVFKDENYSPDCIVIQMRLADDLDGYRR